MAVTSGSSSRNRSACWSADIAEISRAAISVGSRSAIAAPVSLELGLVEHPDRDVERQRADDRRRLVGREGVERLGDVGHRRGERQVRKLTRLGLQQGEEGPPRVQHGHGVWVAPTSALVSTKAITRYTRNPIATTAMARPVVS